MRVCMYVSICIPHFLYAQVTAGVFNVVPTQPFASATTEGRRSALPRWSVRKRLERQQLYHAGIGWCCISRCIHRAPLPLWPQPQEGYQLLFQRDFSGLHLRTFGRFRRDAHFRSRSTSFALLGTCLYWNAARFGCCQRRHSSYAQVFTIFIFIVSSWLIIKFPTQLKWLLAREERKKTSKSSAQHQFPVKRRHAAIVFIFSLYYAMCYILNV